MPSLTEQIAFVDYVRALAKIQKGEYVLGLGAIAEEISTLFSEEEMSRETDTGILVQAFDEGIEFHRLRELVECENAALQFKNSERVYSEYGTSRRQCQAAIADFVKKYQHLIS